MKKMLSVLCIATLLIGTTSCGLVNIVNSSGVTINDSINEMFLEQDDSKNTYNGYSLLVENITSENDKTEVGDITIISDDSYSGIESVNVNNDSIEVIIDDEKKTIELKGTANYVEDEINITITGNISKVKYVDSMLEVDMKFNTAEDVNIITVGNISGDMDVNAQNVFIALNGAGAFDIDGIAKYTNFLINGAGSIEAFDLMSVDTTVEVNGAGVCEVNTTNDLKATINGVGQIMYRGNPVNIDKSVSGLGRVTKDN